MILEIIAEILFELIFFKLPVFIYRKLKLLFIKKNKIRKTKLKVDTTEFYFLSNDKSQKPDFP